MKGGRYMEDCMAVLAFVIIVCGMLAAGVYLSVIFEKWWIILITFFCLPSLKDSEDKK